MRGTQRSGTLLFAAGMVQRPGFGGHVEVFRQWWSGLRSLGWRTVIVDQHIGPEPLQVPAWLAEAGDVAILDATGRCLAGMSEGELRRAAADADALINVMGYLTDPALLASVRRRIFLDIDPGFGQLWKALGLADVFAGHDAFVTVGLTLPTSKVPDCGLDWIPVPPPVHLPHWPVARPMPDAPLTSVISWRGPFDPIEYEGTTYGLRVHEFRRLLDLPARSKATFELALDIDPSDERDRQALLDNGWALVDPRTVAATPEAYRDYLQRSKAELMVAKHLYVATRGGWFSDRSACYLASGRPVVAQDTGFSDVLPIGDGLLAFDTPDEAVAAVHDLDARYVEHCEAARAVAEQHLATEVVLPRLLNRVL